MDSLRYVNISVSAIAHTKSHINRHTHTHTHIYICTFIYIIYIYTTILSCLLYQKSTQCPLASEQSSIIWKVNQWKIANVSFINTRSFMSLLHNHQLKIVSNVEITVKWCQIRMTSLQEGTHISVTHIRRSHSALTFDGNYLLNVFAEQLIQNTWKISTDDFLVKTWNFPNIDKKSICSHWFIFRITYKYIIKQ